MITATIINNVPTSVLYWLLAIRLMYSIIYTVNTSVCAYYV